jgi:hypothetical protein
MSEENWYVADEREDYDFTITSGYDTICGNIGGNTIGEQIDLANRIAKLPQLECELAEAREQRDGLQRELSEMTAYADKLAAGFPEGMLPKDVEVLREANAKLAEEVGEYRGLLIELYNDINVIHSGNAVAKLNRLMRDENYN